MVRSTTWLATFFCMGLIAAAGAFAEEPTDALQQVNVKKLFATHCAWCHGSYGLSADKAPRLAGTPMTEEQVRQRILNGAPGAMPSFGNVLTRDEVDALVRYIKSLPKAS
jgi:mono/diheme cytochrome c family protein